MFLSFHECLISDRDLPETTAPSLTDLSVVCFGATIQTEVINHLIEFQTKYAFLIPISTPSSSMAPISSSTFGLAYTVEKEELSNQSYRQSARMYQWEVALVRNRTELVDNLQLLRGCPTRNIGKASCFLPSKRIEIALGQRLLSDIWKLPAYHCERIKVDGLRAVGERQTNVNARSTEHCLLTWRGSPGWLTKHAVPQLVALISCKSHLLIDYNFTNPITFRISMHELKQS